MAEFREFSQTVQDNIVAKSLFLKEFGPQLGRPHVDTLKNSKHANMEIPLENVMKEFPPERQKRIQEKADQYIKEYKTLQELRKKLNLTQTKIAKNMQINQVSVSNLEKRSDMLLSTLNSYVVALGCELEIFIKTPDQTHVKIEGLIPRENT